MSQDIFVDNIMFFILEPKLCIKCRVCRVFIRLKRGKIKPPHKGKAIFLALYETVLISNSPKRPYTSPKARPQIRPTSRPNTKAAPILRAKPKARPCTRPSSFQAFKGMKIFKAKQTIIEAKM